jgi:G3E family GTPase
MIKVHVLCGFLGSGKTTVLKRMIELFKEEEKRVAVIINEFEVKDGESHLFNKHQLMELLDGCICCTVKNNLQSTLNELVTRHESETIDVLLIEGTGVTHPQEIADAILDQRVQKIFCIESVLGILDATNFLDYLSIFSSSKEVRTLLKEYIQHSSVIVLNKIDRIDQSKVQKILYKIDSMKRPGTPVLTTSFGEIPPNALKFHGTTKPLFKVNTLNISFTRQ